MTIKTKKLNFIVLGDFDVEMTNTYFKEFYKASNPQELTKETSLLKNTGTFNTHWAHLGKSVCS